MAITGLQSIEECRLAEQYRLDGLKTAAERNKWGQFATPTALAQSLARYAHSLHGDQPVRFLDPSVGTGSFYSAVLDAFPSRNITAAHGVELDPLFVDAGMRLWAKKGLRITEWDFTRQLPPDCRYNLVISNPPYVRHHHLLGKDKDRLKAKLSQSLRLEMSGLAGLYCYFMLLCHDWMEEQGLAIWLVPSEFMDVNYGSTVRRYLTEHVTLLHLHRFCPTDAQFTDALVSSAIVVFRKSPPPPGHGARFSFGGSIEAPNTEALVVLNTLRESQKWTQFPANPSIFKTDDLKLGDIFSIKRGLATGSNGFFILTQAEAENWQIPRKFLRPILPGPRNLTNDIVESSPNGLPCVSPLLFLLDCNSPEEEIRQNWPRFYEYILQGREQKIDTAYIASHRTPWYSQENRPPAPYLCTYMGRSRNGTHPFRFIWNRSKATAHNVYLMLYPKGSLRNLLDVHPEYAAYIFETLQNIGPERFISEGRVYGGGLHKVEPKELAKIPAGFLLEKLDLALQAGRQQLLFA